ncbi:MAG: hypothetical protein FJ296_06595, partial [Planctomycetes bacterium]|nr:hypothetical protein [Planctomycetota bacterium]
MSPGPSAPAPSLPTPRTGSGPLLPLLAVAGLAALVFLLPSREGAAPPAPVHQRLAAVRVELDEPPEWARARGVDEVVRCLDRLDWGSHAAAAAARETLDRHAGQLAPELLARLAAVGNSDAVLSAKYVELLGGEDPLSPGVLDELVARGLSFSALEARAALRVLARVTHPRAVNAVRTRLFDQDPEVVGYARGALAEQARRGSEEARQAILDELERDPVDVDMAFLTVAASFPAGDRAERVLRQVAERSAGTVHFLALAGLLARGDAAAGVEFEAMLRDGDMELQQHVLRTLATTRSVLGQDLWDTLVVQDAYPLCAPLVQILLSAMDQGHPDAARALTLLERIASDPTASVQAEARAGLFARRHPNAIEAARHDLQVLVGGQLVLVVDRIVSGPTDRPADLVLRAELAELAILRLRTDTGLTDPDRVSLCRLLTVIAPEAGADVLVEHALERGVSRAVADAVTDQLAVAGVPALERLALEASDPRAAALLVFVAAQA